MNKMLQILLIYFVALSSARSSESLEWGNYKILFPEQDKTENSVAFHFVGKKYVSRKQHLTDTIESKRGREELFIDNVVTSNAAGDREKILSLWAYSERADIAQVMESGEVFERNSAFFRNIESTKLISVVKYDNYYLFSVEHFVKGIGPYLKLYPALLIDNQYFMSNSLKGDVFFEKIASVLLPYMKNIVPVK